MIKGKKVILRKLRKEDFPTLFRWFNDPEVLAFWYGKDRPRSMTWIKKHFEPIIAGKSASQAWAIEAKGRLIGYMYNTPSKDEDTGKFTGRVELDILIGEKDEWGKGCGPDALRTMIAYAFNKQKAERVFIMPWIHNKRAIHVYEKVGLKREGVLRHFEKLEGKWVDNLMMSILRKDFKTT